MFQHLLVPALNGNQSEVQGKKGEKRKLGKQRDPHPRSGDQEQKGVRKMNSTTVQLHIVLYLRGIPQYSCIVMCLRGIPQYSCIVWYLRGIPQAKNKQKSWIAQYLESKKNETFPTFMHMFLSTRLASLLLSC